MPIRRIYLPTGRTLVIRDLEIGDLIKVWCWKCDRLYRLAPHDLIDRYGPGDGLQAVLARDLRCKGCGWRDMIFEIWRASHPDPHPPPNTVVGKIARELGVSEMELRDRRRRAR